MIILAAKCIGCLTILAFGLATVFGVFDDNRMDL